jgi:hypothetical protein
MAALSRSVLLFVCLIAFWPMHTASAMTASAPGTETAVVSSQQPTLDENPESLPTSVRASERVEIGTSGKRAAIRVLHPQATAHHARSLLRVVSHSASNTDWCDVVQCHRMSGALLLKYATSPPSRS